MTAGGAWAQMTAHELETTYDAAKAETMAAGRARVDRRVLRHSAHIAGLSAVAALGARALEETIQ